MSLLASTLQLLADIAPPTNVLRVETSELWAFLPIGYAITVLIELPILYFGLSKRHSIKKRIVLGFWLTACTYPVVVLVLPTLMVGASYLAYLAVAEVFAPLAECLLFRLVDTPSTDSDLSVDPTHEQSPLSRRRDYITIVAANLASFLLGLLLTNLAGY